MSDVFTKTDEQLWRTALAGKTRTVVCTLAKGALAFRALADFHEEHLDSFLSSSAPWNQCWNIAIEKARTTSTHYAFCTGEDHTTFWSEVIVGATYSSASDGSSRQLNGWGGMACTIKSRCPSSIYVLPVSKFFLKKINCDFHWKFLFKFILKCSQEF